MKRIHTRIDFSENYYIFILKIYYINFLYLFIIYYTYFIINLKFPIHVCIRKI